MKTLTIAEPRTRPYRMNDRPAWVAKAMAWMRTERARSTKQWVGGFEKQGVRQLPA